MEIMKTIRIMMLASRKLIRKAITSEYNRARNDMDNLGLRDLKSDPVGLE